MILLSAQGPISRCTGSSGGWKNKHSSCSLEIDEFSRLLNALSTTRCTVPPGLFYVHKIKDKTYTFRGNNKKNNQHCRPEEKYVFNVFFCFFFKMSYSLFSPQKCLFIDSVLQEVSLVCISEPSVRRTVLQLCKVVVGSGNLTLLENLCCSLLQSYLLVSLIRIFNLRS